MKAKTLRHMLRPFTLSMLALALLIFGASGLGRRAKDEDLHLAEQSIRRAAIQCYALEGFYPAKLAYLQQRYGVQVDRGMTVHYVFIGANLMPDITVLANR